MFERQTGFKHFFGRIEGNFAVTDLQDGISVSQMNLQKNVGLAYRTQVYASNQLASAV